MGGIMNTYAKYLVLGVAISTALPVALQAEKAAPVIVSQTVAVEGGRSLQAIVAQADINPSNIAVATGGGLLGGLIGAAVDSARAKKAEELIGPVRTAVADLDADALAIEAAKAAFGETEWFKANPQVGFSKDSSVAGKSAQLDKATGKQIAFVEYSYDLSPTFDAVRVVAKIEVAKKEIPASAKGKAEKRLNPKNLAYSTRVTSVVILKASGEDKEKNALLWSADNGAATRRALKLAFDNLAPLTKRTLSLNAEEVKTLNDKKNKRTTSGGFTGRPQTPANDRSTLLWDGSFINVEYLD
jgi:hypothetical protein